MSKRRSLIIFLALIVLGAGWYWNSKVEAPAGNAVPSKGSPLPLQQAEPAKAAADEGKEGQSNPARDQMKLSPEAKQNYGTQANTEEFKETMKRPKPKSIELAPGVTFESGKGINVKKEGTEESIQIRRDNTYREDEYKVQWEKKF